MALRSLWKGSISFGLVNIPAKLFSAVQDSNLELDMLDKRDHARIRFVRINEDTKKEVPWEQIVKGYKLDDEYVVLDDQDFKAASKAKSDSLEILEFIDEDAIDSIYFEQPYYLEPDKGGVKSYALLRDAMKADRKMGVVLYVLRNKQHLGLLKVTDEVIVLNQIRFREEIRDADQLNIPGSGEVKAKELEMARELIERRTDAFELEAYKDTYKQDLMKIIEAKAKGEAIKVTYKAKKATGSPDLMSQLMASLGDLDAKTGMPKKAAAPSKATVAKAPAQPKAAARKAAAGPAAKKAPARKAPARALRKAS